jgi:hypothetical protein
MTILKERHLALAVILGAAICVIANAYPGKGPFELEGLAGSQDVRTLDRRISLLEQRLYSIEVSLNRLERSAITQRTPASPGVSERDINLLQGEMRTLHLRLSEVECGLAKLDERTTTSAVRDARAKTSDPCRLNPATPVRLSTRP